MAKNRKQRALAKARKDNKITRKEARNLRDLGVSRKQITNTAKGRIKIQKQAAKAASKPKPKAASRPTPPKASAAVSNARKNAQPVSQNISRGDNKPTSPRPGTPAPGSTGNVKNGISGKQANKILRDFKQGGVRLPGTPSTTVDPETGYETTTTTPGEVDYAYYNNNRIYGKAKTALGIKDVNKLSELEEIRAYALSNQNPNAGKRLTDYGIRGSGEFDDIVAALGGDAQAGYEVAEQMRKKGISMTDPRYERVLGQLAKGVQGKGRFGLNSLNLSFGRLANGKLDPVNKNKYQAELKANEKFKGLYDGLADKFAGPNVNDLMADFAIGRDQAYIDGANSVKDEMDGILSAYQTAYDTEMTGYQDQIDAMGLQVTALGDMADGYAATNKYLQDELDSANAYVTAADQRAQNIANSFVPDANPNALSVLAGDFRRSRRKKENNQLSDLAVLTDVGSNESPLAGLQLA